MTRKQIESAIESGIPFTLRMADGREYAVHHSDYIWLPPNVSYAIIHENDGHFTVLPLLTMSGLRSKPKGGGKQKSANGQEHQLPRLLSCSCKRMGHKTSQAVAAVAGSVLLPGKRA